MPFNEKSVFIKRYVPFEMIFVKGCYSFMKRCEYLYKYVACWHVNGNALMGIIERVILSLESLEFLSCLEHLETYFCECNTQIWETSLYPEDIFK